MINQIGRKISLAAVLVLSSSAMFADSVMGTGSSNEWQTWSASQANGNGSTYWNNVSWDGSNKNIGNCLTSSNCGMASVPGALSYLGQANGKAFSNFYFGGAGTAVTATLEAQLAGNAGYDYMGWYNVLNPSQNGLIFSPTSTMGSTVTFTPTAEYGLYFLDAAPGVDDVFLSQSTSQYSNDQGYQHFAVFQQSAGTYYVGAEDLPSSHTDFDYNDMVVKLSTTAAPEPDALLLFGLGATGLGVFRFGRKAKKA